MDPYLHPSVNHPMACFSSTPSQVFLILLHLVKYSLSVSWSCCLQSLSACGRLGLQYVLLKLVTNILLNSAQPSTLFSGKLFNQILAGPSSICGIQRIVHRRFPLAICTAWA